MSTRGAGDERGVVLVTVALWLGLVLIPLCLVFVIDVSSWFTHKRHLQVQADAAAFAGGDLFGSCFSDPPTADGVMQSEATNYSGVPGAAYNGQIGGADQGTLSVLFNSQTYTATTGSSLLSIGGTANPDDTVEGTSCQPGPNGEAPMFDVKMTEESLPLLFNGVIPGLSVVPAINAHARVQLFEANAGRPSLPIAVPNVEPKAVFVSFWNMSNGDHLGTCNLSGPTPAGGPNYLNMWSASCGLTMPSGDTAVGARVGLSNTTIPHSCYPDDGSGSGGEYQCFDQSATTPVVLVRGYRKIGGGAASAKLEDVTETTTCSGSPFFSDISPSPTCTATVRAHVVGPDPTCITVQAQDVNGTRVTMTNVGGTEDWTGNFTYDVAAGQEPVTQMSWSMKRPTPPGCPAGGGGGDFPSPPFQEAYAADADLDVTGPVKVVSLSDYAFEEGTTHSLGVIVGLEANLLSLPVPSPTIILRIAKEGSARTSVVNCDGSGNADVLAAFLNGCQTPYGINPTGVCPDSATDPKDCVPVKTGSLGATIKQVLDQRWAGCPPISFPPDPTQVPPDPRVVQLLVTDLSALFGLQHGAGLTPVQHLANFYVMGWGRLRGKSWDLSCPGVNELPPPGLQSKSGTVAIWGRYIAYVQPGDTGGPNPCIINPPRITPCVPTLVR